MPRLILLNAVSEASCDRRRGAMSRGIEQDAPQTAQAVFVRITGNSERGAEESICSHRVDSMAPGGGLWSRWRSRIACPWAYAQGWRLSPFGLSARECRGHSVGSLTVVLPSESDAYKE